MYQRITPQMMGNAVLTDLTRNADRLAALQAKVSSGKELTRPSDNPYATSRALAIRTDLEATQQAQRNVDDALGWQNVTDVALSKITDFAQRARELVVDGASDSAGPLARQNIAAEIDQIIEAIKQEANASYGGRYVLSGTATNTRPYDTGTAGDTYAGDAGTIRREIGPGVLLDVNAIGDTVLGGGQAANDDRLIDVLRDIADHLRGGTAADANALRGTDLVRMDTNIDALLHMRATIGATGNRLTAASGRLAEVEETTMKLLSLTEDADWPKAVIEYQQQQNTYQAALRSGANVVQLSLLDFLR